MSRCNSVFVLSLLPLVLSSPITSILIFALSSSLSLFASLALALSVKISSPDTTFFRPSAANLSSNALSLLSFSCFLSFTLSARRFFSSLFLEPWHPLRTRSAWVRHGLYGVLWSHLLALGACRHAVQILFFLTTFSYTQSAHLMRRAVAGAVAAHAEYAVDEEGWLGRCGNRRCRNERYRNGKCRNRRCGAG
jgi:hypothetical protein